MKQFLFLIVFFSFLQKINAQTSYTWNGATSTAWNTTTNWTPNGTPGAADNVTIVTGGNNCVLPSSLSITNLTITTGVLNLGGNTLTATGIVSAAGGQCNNGTLSATGATQTFSGTNIGANVNVIPASTNDVYFNGSTFGGSVNITRNNSSNITSTGNNTFNGVTSITNAGTGYLLLTNTAAKIDLFNAALTLTTSNNGAIYIGYTGNATLAANVTINNTSGTGSIQLGRAGNGTVTLNSGFAITTGSFAGGILYLQNFIQIGSTALTLSPGVNGGVDLYSATINGNLIVSAGSVATRNSTYAGTVNLNKLSGAVSNACVGGNTFSSTLTMNYTSTSGNGYWSMGNGSADIYNGDVFANNNSLDRIIFGHASTGNQFNGNVVLTQIGSSVGTALAWNAGSTSTLATGKTVSIGGTGFSVGWLYFQGLTQSGSTAINLSLTGTASLFVGYGNGSGPVIIGGNFTVSAPDVYFRGGTFSGPVVITKTGTGSDHNNGNLNTFNSTCTINQQGSAGYFMLGYNSADAFNDNIILTSTGAGGINLGYSSGTGTPTLASGKTISIGGAGFSAGYLYLGTFTQLGNAAMNLPCSGTAVMTIAVNSVIGGNFTYTGASFTHTSGSTLSGGTTNITASSAITFSGNSIVSGNLTCNGTSTASITFSGNSIINGNLTCSSGDLYFNGSTFNGTVNATKTGANGQWGSGGDTFNGVTTINQTGAAYLGFANGAPDVFSQDVYVNNNSTDRVIFGNSSSGNKFNGNIILTQIGASLGIAFGWNAATDITMAAGKTISIGAAGYSVGYLQIQRFTQLGNAAMNLTCSGTVVTSISVNSAIGGNLNYTGASFTLSGNSTLGGTANITASGVVTFSGSSIVSGNLTCTGADVYFSGATFNGTVNATKTGANGQWGSGGDTFNGVTTINQTGSAYLGFANGAPDVFNADVYINNNSSDRIIFGNNSSGNKFGGNIILTQIGSSLGIAFGWNAATDITLAAGKTISIGAAGFNTGYLQIERFTQVGNTAQTLTLTGTTTQLVVGPASAFGGNVTFSSPSIYLNGCIYSGTSSFTKTGINSDNSAGGNTFTGVSTLINSGSGSLTLANTVGSPDTYATDLTATNNGSGSLYLANNSAGNIFGGNLIFNNSASGTSTLLSIANNGNTSAAITGNLSMNNTGSGTVSNDIYIANNGTITVGGTTTIINNGSGAGHSRVFINESITTATTIFGGDATLSNISTAAGDVYFRNLRGTINFNGNLIVNNTATTASGNNGFYFTWSGWPGIETLANGKTITVGASGFSTGLLQLINFTQIGNTAQSLSLTGSITQLIVGPSSSFGGNVTFSSPSIYLNGCNYAGTSSFTRIATGTANNTSTGGNIFTGVSSVVNNSAGIWYLANTVATPDNFVTDLTAINSGSGSLYLAHNSPGNIFGGNLTFSNTASGINTNIGVAYNTGSSASINGNLLLTNAATGTGNNYAYIANNGSAAITGSVTATNSASGTNSSIVITAGPATSSVSIGGSLSITNTGSASSANDINIGSSVGATTIGGTTSIINNGSGTGHSRVFLNEGSSTASITYGGDATFSNISAATGDVYFRNLRGISTFNGNLIVNGTSTTASGNNGIYLCWSTGNTGSATLANGKTITVGASGFSKGILNLLNFTQIGGTAQSLTLTGTANLTIGTTSAFGGNVTFTSPTLFLNGCTYSGTSSFIKNGVTNDASVGGNIFTGISSITNSGSGIMYLANTTTAPDNFMSNLTANNTGTGSIHLAYNSPGNTFGGNVICGNSATGANNAFTIAANTNATAAITGNLTMNNTGGGTANTLSLANGGGTSVSIGGNLSMNNAGAATTSNDIYIAANGTVTITGTSNITNNSTGGGHSRVFINESLTASTTTFGGDATFYNISTAAGDVYFRDVRGSIIFNGNLIVSNNATTASGNNGYYFCLGTAYTGLATLANGKTITVGTSGFSTGRLQLLNFTQTGGTAQSLTLTGSAALQYGPISSFGGNVTSVSPTLLFNGCTFAGTTTCTKNGSTNDGSIGNNIFTGISNITNSGSGYLQFGNGNRDQWITDATYNNTGSNIIYLASNSVNNTYGGNVTLNNIGSTGNNNGIYICNNTNATGSITGNLIINNNPASGTTNGIRICEAATSTVSIGGTTTITNVNNNTSNYIRFSNGTGSSTIFSGDVTVNNNGTTASSNVVHFGYTGSSTFNGNITLNSNGGAGVAFGASGGTSTQANSKTINTSVFTGGPLYIRNFTQSGPTTGNTSNVSITGANQLLTFNNSYFYDNVTGSSQEITATTSTFKGTTAFTKVSGNANDNFPGGNTFNGSTTITNQSTFILGMANGTADAYNGNVTFVQSGTGVVNPNFNANCTYAANITVTAPAGITMNFGNGGGTATMNGTGTQTINLTTGATPLFTRFVMNHTGTGVTLNTPINISTALTMTSGLLITSATNIPTLQNGCTASALTSASTSYVNGPMRYQKSTAGATTLNLPIGKGADCRPAVLTVSHTGATLYNYTAELFNANPWTAFGSTMSSQMPTTVDTISGVHYWNIARTDGAGTSQPSANLSGNQQIQLYFDLNDQVYQGSSLTVVKNTAATPASWIDIGGTSSLGNFGSAQAGSVTSTSAPTTFTSFSAFTLGSRNAGWNPLPIELLYFNAKPINNTVDLTWITSTETNNKFFTIERSKDGTNFEFVQNVNSEALNGNSTTALNYKTLDLNPYTGTSYYRLKQTDYNGKYTYFNVVTVDFKKQSFVSVYPNPASNNLYVNASNDYENANVKIIDALGREVLSQNLSSVTNASINTSSLESGIYFVLINGVETSKIKITIQK